MKYDVIHVAPVMPLALEIRFTDGTIGQVRFESTHLTGVFKALKNPLVFAQVFIEAGAVTWPDNLDLASDAMYAEIKSHGEWVLR